MSAIGMLIFLLFTFVFVGALGAFLLKFACWIYNYFVGGYRAAELEVNEDIHDESYNVTGPADPNPFASPRQYQQRAELSPEIGVRNPSYLKAVLIIGILTVSFVAICVLGATATAPQELGSGSLRFGRLFVLGAIFAVEFFLLSLILMGMLPTSLVKAMIVAMLYFSMMIVTLFALGVFLYLANSSSNASIELTGFSFGKICLK